MSKSPRLGRRLIFVTVLANAVTFIGWRVWKLLRQQPETERAVMVAANQRPEELNIPLSPETLDEARQAERADEPPQEFELPLTDADAEASAELTDTNASEQAASAKIGDGDDLTRIDGIGPKYASALREMGITTFVELAAQQAVSLSEKLRTRGVRVIGDRIVEEDWIGQAKQLVSKGKEL